MKSPRSKKTTSPVEVQHMSAHGFWLFVESTGRENFLWFSEFPWFKQATVANILAVEIEGNHILHWPELDVDLDLCQLEDPKRYPLIARTKKPTSPLRVAEQRTTPQYGVRSSRRAAR
ncbi:MAG TPA: DUF2442 domain-containing protein [Polyangiaceae bacterium]|nr:DUF2442 domain-containing protein [Polyangiaceae bacterium]